jgi:signal transduction histidine kinase
MNGSIILLSLLHEWLEVNFPNFQFWIIPTALTVVTFFIIRILWKKTVENERIKYEFVTVAAHKLRTPLTKVKWAVDALEDKKIKDKEKKQLISEIGETNKLLIELVNQLLKVSKEDESEYLCKREPYQLEELTKKVIHGFRKEIKKKNIKLIFGAEKNLPVINLDKERIKSVIRILMENAITYTSPLKGMISIVIKKHKKNLFFIINDNGIGIEKEDQPYIFSKFFRTHKAYQTETEGTGVGLFLAKSIIERCYGKLGVESDGEGKGSTFWFSLPIK